MSYDISSTTIAAISTAQGEGGIGVIRISGKDAFTVIDKMQSRSPIFLRENRVVFVARFCPIRVLIS